MRGLQKLIQQSLHNHEIICIERVDYLDLSTHTTRFWLKTPGSSTKQHQTQIPGIAKEGALT